MKKNVIYFAAMMLTWGFISCSEDIASEIDETLKDSSKVGNNEATKSEYLLGKWELIHCYPRTVNDSTFSTTDDIGEVLSLIYPIKSYDFTKTFAMCIAYDKPLMEKGQGTESIHKFPKWIYSNNLLTFYSHELENTAETSQSFGEAKCMISTNNELIIIKGIWIHRNKSIVEKTYKFVYKKI